GDGRSDVFGVDIVDIGRRSDGRLLRFLLTGCRMFRAVLSCRAKICHFHDPELIPYALLLKIFGRKVIYDVHEDVPRQVLSKYWVPEILKPVVSTVVSIFESIAGALLSGVVAATPRIAKRFPA